MTHTMVPADRTTEFVDPAEDNYRTNQEKVWRLVEDIETLGAAYQMIVDRTYPNVPDWAVSGLREFQCQLARERDERGSVPAWYFDCHCADCR